MLFSLSLSHSVLPPISPTFILCVLHNHINYDNNMKYAMTQKWKLKGKKCSFLQICNEKQKNPCVWESHLCGSSSIKQDAAWLMDNVSVTANRCAGEKQLKRKPVSTLAEWLHGNHRLGCVRHWQQYVHTFGNDVCHIIGSKMWLLVFACRLIESTSSECNLKICRQHTSNEVVKLYFTTQAVDLLPEGAVQCNRHH